MLQRAFCHIFMIVICDRVYKNQSYLHIKFDLILSLSNLITLFPTIVLYIIYIKFPKEFHKTYRYCITHTEKEIDIIGVFCADKTCFRRLGYICISYTTERVWYPCYYRRLRRSRGRVLITMIPYE